MTASNAAVDLLSVRVAVSGKPQCSSMIPATLNRGACCIPKNVDSIHHVKLHYLKLHLLLLSVTATLWLTTFSSLPAATLQ